MKIKKSGLPVYQSIKTEMREWIQTGIWETGSLIPGEATLATLNAGWTSVVAP